MAQLNTSVTVDFELSSVSGTYLAIEVDRERVPPQENQVYLRIFPGVPDKTLLSSGSMSGGSIRTVHETDYVVFTGSRQASLKRKGVSGVTLVSIGTYLDKQGKDVAVSFTYDPVRNVVKADKECFGVVEVSYDAPYASYLYTFAGTPCKLTYVPSKGMVASGGWLKGTVIAIDFNPKLDSAYITLNPPDCSDLDRSVYGIQPGAEEPKLKIEVLKNHPPRLTGVDSTGKMVEASCRIRVVPDIGATIKSSTGTLTPTASGTEYEDVIDAVTFSGGDSVNLTYQPNGGAVSIQPIGTFFNKYGSAVGIDFGLPGDTVTEVDWLSESTYTNPRPRIVRPDEIVAVDSGRKVIEVFGAIEASYSISYRSYKLIFDFVDSSKPVEGWKNSHVVAFFQDYTAHLLVNPPTFRER